MGITSDDSETDIARVLSEDRLVSRSASKSNRNRRTDVEDRHTNRFNVQYNRASKVVGRFKKKKKKTMKTLPGLESGGIDKGRIEKAARGGLRYHVISLEFRFKSRKQHSFFFVFYGKKRTRRGAGARLPGRKRVVHEKHYAELSAHCHTFQTTFWH